MADIEVKELSKEDAPEIEALFKEVWTRADEYPKKWKKKRTLTREQIENEMNIGYHYFGIRIKDKLVGVYKAIITEYGLFGEHQSVDPAFRRRGLATAMYHHFIQYAKEHKCKKVYVNILTNQVSSRKIVEKFGFHKRGRVYEQDEGMLVQIYEKEV